MKKLYILAISAIAAAASASAATANGTTTDGWYMIEDYQAVPVGTSVEIRTPWGEGVGTATVIADPTDASNYVAEFVGGDYNTLFNLNVTLPTGKTLKDYSNFVFDLYRFTDDSDYKKMNIYVDGITNAESAFHVDENYIHQGDAEKWTVKSYTIDENETAGNTFTVMFGIATNDGHYAIDNVRLKERPQAVAPGTYAETKNGTVSGDLLYVEDYQTSVPGAEVDMWGRWGSIGATVLVAVDPQDATNLVAEFVGGNYNEFMNFNVVLPEGKKLSDYKGVSFDFYRYADDENYKKMMVWVGTTTLYQDDGYPNQGSAETWMTKTYDFVYPEDAPADLGDMTSFSLRAGLSTKDAGHYALDNVKLIAKEGTTTSISDVDIDNNAPAEYYTISGVRVAPQNLTPGIYVRLQNGKAQKIVLK